MHYISDLVRKFMGLALKPHVTHKLITIFLNRCLFKYGLTFRDFIIFPENLSIIIILNLDMLRATSSEAVYWIVKLHCSAAAVS